MFWEQDVEGDIASNVDESMSISIPGNVCEMTKCKQSVRFEVKTVLNCAWGWFVVTGKDIDHDVLWIYDPFKKLYNKNRTSDCLIKQSISNQLNVGTRYS